MENVSLNINNTNNQTSLLDYLNPFKFIGYLASFLYVISFITDILCLGIIYKSRSKLKKVEICILKTCQALTFSYKMFSLLLVLDLYYDVMIFGSTTCIFLYPFTFTISTCFNTILVYYALCHYSSIERTGHYLTIFNFTHNVRNFVRIAIAVFLLAISSMLVMFHSFRKYIFDESDGKCHIMYKNPIVLGLLTWTGVPLVFVLSTYVLSIGRLVTNLKSNRTKANSVEMKRYRKKFKISLKFLSFSFLPLFSCCVRLSFVVIANLCPTCQRYVYDLCQFLIIVTYILEPSVLIYVHNVLHAQFFNLLSSLKIIKTYPNSSSITSHY